jgi:hypothetical protein
MSVNRQGTNSLLRNSFYFLGVGMVLINLAFHTIIWTLLGGVKANYRLYEVVTLILYFVGIFALLYAVYLRTGSILKAVGWSLLTYLVLPSLVVLGLADVLRNSFGI